MSHKWIRKAEVESVVSENEWKCVYGSMLSRRGVVGVKEGRGVWNPNMNGYCDPFNARCVQLFARPHYRTERVKAEGYENLHWDPRSILMTSNSFSCTAKIKTFLIAILVLYFKKPIENKKHHRTTFIQTPVLSVCVRRAPSRQIKCGTSYFSFLTRSFNHVISIIWCPG